MSLNIKDPETERLARMQRSRRARRSPLQSVERSRNGCAASDLARARQALLEDLAAIRQRWSAPPVLEARNADEIIGYDESGLPG
jgi:antitoxin VapB